VIVEFDQEAIERRAQPMVDYLVALINKAVEDGDRTVGEAAGQIFGIALARAFILEQVVGESGHEAFLAELRIATPLPGETVADE
jgi:hypothetical protein